MVTYTIEAPTTILVNVPAIGGWPAFKGLWDTQVALLEKLCKIKHHDHLLEGMAGIMMTPAAYAIVSPTP